MSHHRAQTGLVTSSWTAAELETIGAAGELEIAVTRLDATLRPWTPIWVVVAGPDVFVRTWFQRETGWFGAALRSGRARVRVPGLEIDVFLAHVGSSEARSAVDDAYRAKYGSFGAASADRMCTEQAVATTLRLSPAGH
ncbi:DUF2255 family protein [Nakamurella flavida]